MKKEKEMTFDIFYCTACKGLVFEIDVSMSKHGCSNKIFTHGYYEEDEFDIRDVDVWDECCADCGANLAYKLSIKESYIQEIEKKIKESGDKIFPLLFSEKVLKKIQEEDITGEELDSYIFQALL